MWTSGEFDASRPRDSGGGPSALSGTRRLGYENSFDEGKLRGKLGSDLGETGVRGKLGGNWGQNLE